MKTLFRLTELTVFLVTVIFLCTQTVNAEGGGKTIIVSKDGTGEFRTITEAVNSLPQFNYERIVIIIKNGVYEEKIRIDQDNITLQGEDREKTIIQFNQLREDWNRKKDSVGPAVINLFGDDIILKNLTVKNTQAEIGPHAFAVYGTGTRIITVNCSFFSRGADTVSLWAYKDGMYFHDNCLFEGAVDLLCPRGWCYVSNSEIRELKKTAAIWHAGGHDKNQKFVLRDCRFSGVEGFELGRHHYDAQFILITCTFAKEMSDKPIYRVRYEDSAKNRPNNWGDREYYFNCRRDGGDYMWHSDNFITSESLNEKAIDPAWTFGHLWDPVSPTPPKLVDAKYQDNILSLEFNEVVSVKGNPVLVTSSGKQYKYYSGGGSRTVKFIAENITSAASENTLRLTENSGELIGTVASVDERKVKFPKDLEQTN